jgi:RimJ/RimL family protein N-acetyltransferase
MAQGVIVQGERVCLCPFEDIFWSVGLEWYNDPEIIAMTSDDLNPLEEVQFRAMIQMDLDNAQSMVFGIRNESDVPIGIGMIRSIDQVHRGCDLHITIGERDHWNRGYGAEAIGLMRDYVFQNLGMHKVISTPFANNVRMVRCLEKCGFQEEGVLRDALWVDGGFINVAIMGVIGADVGCDDAILAES